MASFRRREILKGTGAALAAAALPGARALAQAEPPKPAQIVINDSGGAMQSAMRQLFYSEFERRYGIKVVATSPVDLGKLQAQVQSGNVEWTVTEIGGEDAIRAERSGLLERLDLKIIDLSRFPKHLQNRQFVFPKAVYSTVMGYRGDVFPEGKRPQSWADFWDVAKFPGPRTLQNSATDNLEFALLADGVPADKLYPLDVDRAFRKLDEIKPHIAVWWKTGAQSQQILRSGEVDMTMMWAGTAFATRRAGVPIAWTYHQAIADLAAWAILRGAPHPNAAKAFINFYIANPEAHAAFAREMGYATSNKGGVGLLPPEIRDELVSSPEVLAGLVRMDANWVEANRAATLDRWNRWLAA